MRKVVIHGKRRIFDGFFKIDEANLAFERFDGTMSPSVTRLVFERGDSIGVVVYDREAKRAILTKQFRYPTYENGPGWLLETVAGMIDPGESPEATARRELLEEIGYAAETLEPIATFYLSPGGTSERVHLFYAEVGDDDHVGTGGGEASENEDIQAVAIAPDELAELVRTGGIHDAKTLIGAQWLLQRLGQ